VSRGRLVGLAVAVGLAAVLAAGYAAAGPAGLIDAATAAAVGVLIVARGTVRGQEPRAVRLENTRRIRRRAPAVRVADFPAYRKIASDLSWAQVSGRHYEYSLRPTLTRLAVALDRRAVAADLAATPPADHDGSGPGPAELDRIVTRLEGAEGFEVQEEP
jgi:hypothetical protein